MTPTEWIASERGQAVVDKAARALWEVDGYDRRTATWETAQGRDWITKCATAVVRSLLSPGEQPCPECDGKGIRHYITAQHPENVYESVDRCERCRGSGTVPGVPAIIDAMMRPVTDEDFQDFQDDWANTPEGHVVPGFYRLRRPEETP